MKARAAPIVTALLAALLIGGACLRMDTLANQSFRTERRAQLAAGVAPGGQDLRPYSTPLRMMMLFCTVSGAGAAFLLHARALHKRALLARLEADEQARRRWVADTSHELRTPLTILATRLEALRDGMLAPTPAQFAVLADTVQDMERLVGDLHQLARADAGALALERDSVDLAELIDDAWRACAPAFAAQGLTLQREGLGPGLVLQADARRLAQLMTNLWTNTVRYTDRGGRARLSVTCAPGMLTLRFEDSAPGVPDAALARLGERFFRVDSSRSRAGGGSGLGLAICRAIAEAHGGSLHASHSALGGLCIALRLPHGARP